MDSVSDSGSSTSSPNPDSFTPSTTNVPSFQESVISILAEIAERIGYPNADTKEVLLDRIYSLDPEWIKPIPAVVEVETVPEPVEEIVQASSGVNQTPNTGEPVAPEPTPVVEATPITESVPVMEPPPITTSDSGVTISPLAGE